MSKYSSSNNFGKHFVTERILLGNSGGGGGGDGAS